MTDGPGAFGDDLPMPRLQRTYDHRLRDLVRRTRDLTIATRAGVPRSTAADWLELAPGKEAARRKRLETNRSLSCAVCDPDCDSDAA